MPRDKFANKPVEKKYVVTDFRHVYQGTFTQKECEEFFGLMWKSISQHLYNGNRIHGLYYITEEKDLQVGE